jgi:glutathione S-transferase
MTTAPVTLYGVPHSLYTGRVRSYLLKAGIPYREQAPTTAHFREVVVPAAGGRLGLPTVELPEGRLAEGRLPEGRVIRDGAAIIDHFEAASGHGFSPASPRQRVLSRLLDVIGAEGLLRPAMHYRWNFPEQNGAFLSYHFRLLFPRGPDRAALADAAADRMRDAARAFGVTPETQAVVEALDAYVLEALNVHFSEHPYLLGARPCIGDFGMIAPLFAHLGRDPAPLALMQARAPALLRWVERMNRPEPDLCEFDAEHEDFAANDAVADTLVGALRILAEDFVPETLAAAATIDAWLAEQDAPPTGAEVPRGVGFCRFTLRGVEITALAQPYRFYLLKRVQDEYAALDAPVREDVHALLAACGMESLLDARISRGMRRENNLEVWL